MAMTDPPTEGPRRTWRWFILAAVVVGLFFVNSVRSESCAGNREDRLRSAEEFYASMAAFTSEEAVAIMRSSNPLAFAARGEQVADSEHPTLWYCFGSDR